MCPKISIIIPTYNCARYITEAIESVLSQTYKDFEIIVVDDGSTDNTRELLHNYIGEGQIRYILQQNQGPGAARNTGIKEAKGKYVAFLDSDDALTPESIERRALLIDKYPKLDFVFSDYYLERKSQLTIKSGELKESGALCKFSDCIEKGDSSEGTVLQ